MSWLLHLGFVLRELLSSLCSDTTPHLSQFPNPGRNPLLSSLAEPSSRVLVRARPVAEVFSFPPGKKRKISARAQNPARTDSLRKITYFLNWLERL